MKYNGSYNIGFGRVSKMKVFIDLIKQSMLVFLILQLGNFISGLIKHVILIPGSIMGMAILFILLVVGVIKVKHIDLLSNFMLKHMGFFFIPLGVGLLNTMDLLQTSWLPLLSILILSGALVMLVSAKVTDMIITLTNRSGV